MGKMVFGIFAKGRTADFEFFVQNPNINFVDGHFLKKV
jgi:hypothetical protein